MPSELLFDDAESITQRGELNVVHARAESVASFGPKYFAGFTTMRALTYSSSIPMIAGLLAEHDFDAFECIFGHGGILSRDAADILAFQDVVADGLRDSIVALHGVAPERREVIHDRVAREEVRFFVVKDVIAHAKIYLLEGEDRKRVIVGSANLSERAFSGRQAETLIVFDDDEVAWQHYTAQYEAVRDVSTSRLPLREEAKPAAEKIWVEQVPAFVEAERHPDGTTLYVPNEVEAEQGYSVAEVVAKVEAIKPTLRRGMADMKPDRRGRLRLTPRIVKQIARIVHSRHAETAPATYLSRTGQGFILSGEPISLDVEEAHVQQDVACWLEFFRNYENGFVGDVARLQRDYFTFLCWFYISPLMCDLRNAALRNNAFSFDQPLFAVLFGASNCGKTSLVETLMASMFQYPRIIDTQDFTPGKLRGLQQAYKRFPVVFDDVTRDRFSRYADEIIKDETIPYHEYPCFALSMNADARSFKAEIIKRCLMIYTRTSLPGDNTAARKSLQRSVAAIRERLSTALYRRFLQRAMALVDEALEQDHDVDALHLSSKALCAIFEEHSPAPLPDWCAPMTLEEYQQRAFERPRLLLNNILHGDRYDAARRPPEGCWTTSGERIVIGVAPMEANRTRADIPDWLLDDGGSASGQITLNREYTEEFLNRPVRAPRWWRR